METKIISLIKEDIKTTELGVLTSDQELKIKTNLQFTQNVIKTFGYNKDSNQLVFRLLMFRSLSFSGKIVPLLTNLFEILEPVNLTPKVKMKTICIFDHMKGYEGRYSLVMNSKKQFGIVKELNGKIELHKNFDSFSNLEEALKYISKNLYYYDK